MLAAARGRGERVGRHARTGHLRSTNVAVDAANTVALRSGFPVTVVDFHHLRGELRVAATAPDTRLVVDGPGTTADVGGLPSLDDTRGPCVTLVASIGSALTTPTDNAHHAIGAVGKPRAGARSRRRP